MIGRLLLLASAAAVFLAGALGASQGPKTGSLASFRSTVQPVLAKYCLPCHSGKAPTAGLDLSKFSDKASVYAATAVWQKARTYLESQRMPPEGQPSPPPEQRAAVLRWIDAAFPRKETATDTGHVTMRRLNRAEYTNTIHDLLGVDFKGADDFPSDDVGYGFDNIGDVLSMSTLHLEKYINAAEQAARTAIIDPNGATLEYEPGAFKYDMGRFAPPRDEDLVLFSNGAVTLPHNFPRGGHYVLKVLAYGDQAGPEPCRMVVSVDGAEFPAVYVKGRSREEAAEFLFPATIKSGEHIVGVAFTNDYYHPEDPDPKNRDRNLALVSLSIQGPETPEALMPATQKALIPAKGKELEAAREFFAQFALRAYRRPPTREEVQRLASCVSLAMKGGDTYERGLQLGIEAALVSPNFLFRAEPEAGNGANRRLLTGYEIASRLSYFLWSSMPDDRLFKLAASGALSRPEAVASEAMRMLQDPKTRALGDNFAAQWLTLRKLAYSSPDRKMFTDFNEPLRRDMGLETIAFFQGVVGGDRPILDFLTGKYTYLNSRLAKLYGIPGVEGDQFRKVSLEGTPRCGVLTQASVLTVTSNPTRTSPVKRGKWVLEQLMGTPLPPPPPGVGVLKEGPNLNGLATLRARMEVHRKDPSCAACHERMDPLGFGLENFDAIGKWRTMEGASPIDASGRLPDGRSFNGPEGLVKILADRKDQFVRNFGEKLLTYALGRGPVPADRPVVDHIAKSGADDGYRFSAIVKAIVTSDPFRKAGAEGGAR